MTKAALMGLEHYAPRLVQAIARKPGQAVAKSCVALIGPAAFAGTHNKPGAFKQLRGSASLYKAIYG
jgi:hypothetical protein